MGEAAAMADWERRGGREGSGGPGHDPRRRRGGACRPGERSGREGGGPLRGGVAGGRLGEGDAPPRGAGCGRPCARPGSPAVDAVRRQAWRGVPWIGVQLGERTGNSGRRLTRMTKWTGNVGLGLMLGLVWALVGPNARLRPEVTFSLLYVKILKF